MKLTQVLEEFLSKNQDLEWNTLQSYKRAWNKLIKAIGNKEIFECNKSDAEDFRSWLFRQNLKVKTVDTYIRNAKPVMAWSIRRGYRKDNPFEGLRLPKVPEKEIRVFSDAELCAILRCANLLWRARIVTAASAGLRIGEIQNLTWRDVNFDEGFIVVQAKEGTANTWPWTPKNHKSRQVPLSKQLEKLFTQLYEKLPDKQPYIMLREERYFDLQQRRLSLLMEGKELDDQTCKRPDSSERRWDRIRINSQVRGKFHDLRSTAITNWLLSGIPPQEVQRMAGHASIEVTMKYYAACRSDYIQKAKLEIGVAGCAPTTSRPPDERSTKLSYTP